MPPRAISSDTCADPLVVQLTRNVKPDLIASITFPERDISISSVSVSPPLNGFVTPVIINSRDDDLGILLPRSTSKVLSTT